MSFMSNYYINKEEVINAIFNQPCKVDEDGWVWLIRADLVKVIDELSVESINES